MPAEVGWMVPAAGSFCVGAQVMGCAQWANLDGIDGTPKGSCALQQAQKAKASANTALPSVPSSKKNVTVLKTLLILLWILYTSLYCNVAGWLGAPTKRHRRSFLSLNRHRGKLHTYDGTSLAYRQSG